MAIHRTFDRRQVKRASGPDIDFCDGVVSTRILRALYDSEARLHELGVPHALVGGLAVGAYGAPRATKDVDFLVGEEAFVHHGMLVSFRPGLPISSDGVAVDPISVGNDEHFLRKEFESAATSHGIPIIGLEPLIYMKLSAGRHRDLDDVTRLLNATNEDPARAYLNENAPDLIPLLEKCLRHGESQ